jgi:hypothetical protein
MRKVIVAVILLCCAWAAFAEEEAVSPFNLTVGADCTASIVGIYVTPTVGFFWQPKVFGLGVEGRYLIGTTYGDMYLVGFGILKLWWLYAGVGVELPVSMGALGTMTESQLLPAVTLGLNAPIVKLGPGKLGINASTDFIITATAVDTSADSLGEAIGNVVGAAFILILGGVKVDLGVTYSIPL